VVNRCVQPRRRPGRQPERHHRVAIPDGVGGRPGRTPRRTSRAAEVGCWCSVVLTLKWHSRPS